MAFYTVPAHTEAAHRLMYWHLGLSLGAMALFGLVVRLRARLPDAPPPRRLVLIAVVAAAVLAVAGDLGGRLVFRGGAGVDPEVLSPEVRQGHSQGGAPEGAHDDGQLPRGR